MIPDKRCKCCGEPWDARGFMSCQCITYWECNGCKARFCVEHQRPAWAVHQAWRSQHNGCPRKTNLVWQYLHTAQLSYKGERI